MRGLLNTFGVGEELDILIKENETLVLSLLVQDSDPTQNDPVTGAPPLISPTNLTGATLWGGIYERYDAPEPLKSFTFTIPDVLTGIVVASMDLGRSVPLGIDRVAWDVVVKPTLGINAGRRLRIGAGFATISRGVSGLT